MRPMKSRREAAQYLNNKGIPTTESTLATLASRGGGPAFSKFGARALYSADDLDAWVDAKLSRPMPHTSAA